MSVSNVAAVERDTDCEFLERNFVLFGVTNTGFHELNSGVLLVVNQLEQEVVILETLLQVQTPEQIVQMQEELQLQLLEENMYVNS